MDTHKIDQLFRDKMSSFEVTPSESTWAQIQKKQKPRRRPLVYWAAAALTLWVVLQVLIPKEATFDTHTATLDSTYPPVPQLQYPSGPIAVSLVDKPELQQQPQTAPVPQSVAQKQKTVTEEVIKENGADMEPHAKTIVAENTPAPTIEKVEAAVTLDETKTNTVKITYIASKNTGLRTLENSPSDSSGRFKKWVALTEKIATTEMLASVKTAKDRLLNGGFKKNKRAMNP